MVLEYRLAVWEGDDGHFITGIVSGNVGSVVRPGRQQWSRQVRGWQSSECRETALLLGASILEHLLPRIGANGSDVYGGGSELCLRA
jgi:hypothetical protein